MSKLEDVIQEENKFSEAYQAIEALTDIAKEMPNLQKFFMEVYNDPKRETKFADYQYRERAVDRVLFRDRKHPLDTVIINDFNQKTGSNLDEVKILYGSGADEYTRSRHALALAVADKIYFRNGAYKPETEEGRALLAHELKHVSQNKENLLADNRSMQQLEGEAELEEAKELHDPDPFIVMKLDGQEIRLRKSQKKMIEFRVKKAIEEWVDNQENTMREEGYLKLLISYSEWLKRNPCMKG